MPIRLAGINSGMDTDAIVSALVSGYKTKKDKLVKAQTKQSWKMDAWKGVNSKVYSLYTSLDKMRLSTGYNTKKTTVSDATKATVTAKSNAVNGTQTLKIKELATAGYLTGAKLKGSVTPAGTSALSSLKYKDQPDDTSLTNFSGSGRITVNTASGSTDIEINDSMTINDVVSKLKDAGVNASFDATNGRMFVSAKESGAANDFSLVGTDQNGINALKALGLNTASTAATSTFETYAKSALNTDGQAYYQTDSDGNLLKDAGGNYLTNGTYSATKTQEAIETIMDSLKSAHTTVTDKTTENARLRREADYATAAKGIADKIAADASGNDAAKKADALLDATGEYASVRSDGNGGYEVRNYTERIDNGDGTYTYVVSRDENGNITDSDTVSDTVDYTVSSQLTQYATDAGLITPSTDAEGNPTTDESAWTKFKADHTAVKAFKDAAEIDANAGDATASDYMAEVDAKIANGTIDDLISSKENDITTNNGLIASANNTISDNATWDVSGIGGMSGPASDPTSELGNQVAVAMDKINMANNALAGGLDDTYSDGATRVNGKDAKIVLNNAEFTSSSNKFEINGLTINATATTAEGETLTITTSNDSQGMYDKIKDWLSQYNEVMQSLASSYNAEAAKGYDPLTEEEKEAMSDTEIEKWETKAKGALLRRDQTLGSIMTTISNSMAKSYSVTLADGTTKNMSLASLGIKTGGYLTTSANSRNAYHIDGDADDELTSSNADKLMKMLEEDPEAVESLMKQVTNGLYDALDKKMKSTTISSAYTIYNDKEMGTEYSSYTKQIKTWEDRLADMEDRYYKQFAAMEKMLGTLNASQSQFGAMLGG